MTTTTRATKKYPRALIRLSRTHMHQIHLLNSPTETPNEENLVGRRYSDYYAAQLAKKKVTEARNRPEPTA